MALGLVTLVLAGISVYALTRPVPTPTLSRPLQEVTWAEQTQPKAITAAFQGTETTPASKSAAASNQVLLAVPSKALNSGWYAVRIGAVNKLGPTSATECMPLGIDGHPQFMGSSKATHYHYPNCEWANKIPKKNKVYFLDAECARALGYEPCRVCNPPTP
jgi:hypothetical protein